ncbi:hypothetical protein CBW16_10815 [Flavobacteriaceae bacterium JJC]|uniref:DUF4265 domain-containing protein n=1 Tax=Kaistella soli TaxID=2849654 RepID=UPI000B4B1F22|nr:DUF4265 domain-containing protein [Kaistella soli]MBU8882474.1 DUF4265 domain-containing protein [Kaistella soli]OWK73234.1 hypothetical protein CBW16_10815 [Flavobacteriaceae bacterium JJC]
MKDENVKILFRFFSDVLEEWTVETMWAETVDAEKGLYKLANIPFYASVSCDDIVYAEYDEDEQRLIYRKTIEQSGNSTIQVVVMDKTIVTNDLRETFNSLGCESEKFSEGYFVIEVPKHLDYKPIRKKLVELEEQEKIGYAEPNLAENHYY